MKKKTVETKRDGRYAITEAKKATVILPARPEEDQFIYIINKSSDEITVQAAPQAVIHGYLTTKPGGKMSSVSQSASMNLIFVGKSNVSGRMRDTWVVWTMVGEWDVEVDDRKEEEVIQL